MTLPLLPMLPEPRPVVAGWKCQRSGDCCSIPREVVMTREERTAILPKIPEGIKTLWRDVDEKFVALKAGPCPFFIFKECVVYPVRPYNCRRFGCMRPDPETEPFELDRRGNCANQMDRVVTSKVARKEAERIQRKAQGWADSHGWRP